MLRPLGIEPDEETVYRALLGRPTATPPQLAEILGLSEPDVDKALARLEDHGLVQRQPDGAYGAAPPAVALGALITDRRDALRMAERALTTLAEQHRAALAGHTVDSLIEVVQGVDAIRRRFLQVQQAARVQVRTFITTPYIAVPPGQNTAEPAAVDRGVRFRAVMSRAVLEYPGNVEETIDSLSRGVELRIAEELPVKLIIADSDLALLNVAVEAGGEPRAVLLHRSGLLTALDALFETVWSRAHPLELFTEAAGTQQIGELDRNGLTGLDRKIIALLLAGLGDQAVATQLDLSMRTLQRRLRHLMDIADVRTRMQLGWYAAENGWVRPA
jgi:sugar-specific transcriptional regulator TrmB/DNA-binding CsgD family transcriptional regulator